MHARTSDRYCGPAAPSGATGSSPTADSFGATISLPPAQGRSLFFVLGRTGSPEVAVRGAGGTVVTHLPDPRRVLALLPFDAFPGLQRHPEVALAGPVGIDPQRFAGFARLIGLDEARAEKPP